MLSIGIDIGGTKIASALINPNGEILSSTREAIPTEEGLETILPHLKNLVAQIQKQASEPIVGVGISLPGFIDNEGTVVFAGTALKKLVGIPIQPTIEQALGLPVKVANDANCFALAEAVYGAGRNYRYMIGVIWGTGIGAGIILDKKIYSGTIGGAGELGHIVVDPALHDGFQCECGHHGCLENLASGKNISRIYREEGGAIPNATVKQIYDSPELVAKKVIAQAIHSLGQGIATMVNLLNPGVIVLGGGLSQLADEVYARLNQEMKQSAIPSLTQEVSIVRYQINDYAGVLGAGHLVLQKNVTNGSN